MVLGTTSVLGAKIRELDLRIEQLSPILNKRVLGVNQFSGDSAENIRNVNS